MSQSKRHSLLETLTNVGTGFIASLFIWEVIVRPVYGIERSRSTEGIEITLIFTASSIIRGYLFRRLFNSTIPDKG
jgi:hypothetical protein